MASSQRPTPGGVNSVEEFTLLTLQYLDGAIGGDELAALEAALRDSAPERDLFVQLCQLHASLLEAFRARREHLQRAGTGSPGEPAHKPGEDTIFRNQGAADTVRVPRRPDAGPTA